jgi:hypothetical protein
MSLRAMLFVILGIAVWLGWWVNSSHNQQVAVAAVTTAPYSANVWYDDEFDDTPSTAMGGQAIIKRRGTWIPASIEARLGKDFFHSVIAVAFSKPGGEISNNEASDHEVFRKVVLAGSLDQLNPNVEVTDEDIPHIASLPYLKRLSLRADSPRLTDASLKVLARMPRLEFLEICSAPITDAGLAHLREMRQLRSLLLGEAQPFSSGDNQTAVTGEGFAHLAGLPSLTDLEIHSTALTGEGLKHIGSLKHLERLKLQGGAFSDDDLRSLSMLTNLQSLEIVGSSIDGTGFRHLAALSRLSYVCLEGPNVTDAAMPYLAQLPSLESVMIYETRVTASGLEAFRTAPRLSQMGLSPAVSGDTKRLKQALPNCNVINGGKVL